MENVSNFIRWACSHAKPLSGSDVPYPVGTDGVWCYLWGTKGQIVLPKEARDLFDIQPGDSLILLADTKRGIAIPPKSTFEAFSERIFNLKDGEED